MLELKNISKIYKTSELKQIALDKININFRKNEFASILGPSGSGKTTLLNIIGGLDRYDSGDLIINEVSTKNYKDRDFDSYRNHRVGFVFQSYNLISHQTVLKNVELALTLSGISKKERVKRAKQALKDVGLEKHISKRPNQLSGGQMQRVAIARALVNDPDILLADEPTGALDSITSEQIMELLKTVANDKLVIMVTHNPDLAEKYSTRIIKLKDGSIVDDTNPYDGKENSKENDEIEKKKSKKTSMSLFTALSLSLNNLLTKKGRTFLTAFAGSIGIIGITLILALSSGVQSYIDKQERETLTGYPISIEETTTDLNTMMSSYYIPEENKPCKKDSICTVDDLNNNTELRVTSMIKKNNLNKFKKYLDSNDKINNYVTDIKYLYDVDLQIYSIRDNNITMVNPNTFSLSKIVNSEIDFSKTSMNYAFNNNSYFKELINNNKLLESQYDLLYGKLPSNYDEMVLIVDEDYNIPETLLYALDYLDRNELETPAKEISSGKQLKFNSVNYDYDYLLSKTYKLVLQGDYYKKENNVWINYSSDEEYLKSIVNNGIELKIVGILKVNKESPDTTSGYIGYSHDLVEYVINNNNEKEIVKEQLNDKEKDVLTGIAFDNDKTSYDLNKKTLEIVDYDYPTRIDIYPKDFTSKEKIEKLVEEYNNSIDSDDDKIIYTDMIGVLLSSITSIVNIISYILIAFVGVSLVVSSIMISIITYISVLERTKEIGILRAIGASKKDIVRVFNAETIIEGFIAGVIGVGFAFLLTLPINAIVNNIANVSNVATVKITHAIILISISVILNLIAGLIPASTASKKDPVESLRSE